MPHHRKSVIVAFVHTSQSPKNALTDHIEIDNCMNASAMFDWMLEGKMVRLKESLEGI